MTPIESHLPISGKPLDLEVSRLRKTYSAAPVIIDGVISDEPQGTMSSRVFGGGYRVHIFSFAAWKIGEQQVRTDKLVLSRAIPNSEEFDYLLEKFSYHRIRALFSEESTRAVVLSGLESDHCPTDLSAAAAGLTVPVVISHAQFGTLTLDRGLHLFSGNMLWNGSDVAVTLPSFGEEIDSGTLHRAEQIMRSQGKLGKRVSQFLLDSVTTELSDEDSGLEVRESMFELQGLHFETDCIEFWYNDAGLWGEHSLVIRLNTNDELKFSIEG